jgi:2'-5' RNA ligase
MSRFALLLLVALVSCSPGQDAEPELVAIDVLLDPEPSMAAFSVAANERLRENHPAGFELGAGHAPHITVLQRFVRADELGEVAAAVEEVTRRLDATGLELTATGYYYRPHEALGLAGITVTPTPELLAFQAEIIAAVQPFSAEDGTGEAFVQNPDGIPISQSTVDNMKAFVPKSSGRNYDPHITLGLAEPAFLDSLLGQPFTPISFAPESVSIYQLGDLGTAQRKLWPRD